MILPAWYGAVSQAPVEIPVVSTTHAHTAEQVATPTPSGGYVAKALELGAVQVYANEVADGQWKDESGNGHHATLVGATVEEAGGPTSGLPRYLKLDGVDDRASVPHHAQISLGADDSGTHFLFLRRPAGFGNSDSWATAFSKGDGDYEFRRESDSADNMRFDPQASSGTEFAVPADEWAVFAPLNDPYGGASNESEKFIYERGEQGRNLLQQSTRTSYLYDGGTLPFQFGARNTGTGDERYFDGDIAGYALFPNILLNTTQLEELYQAAQEEPPSPD